MSTPITDSRLGNGKQAPTGETPQSIHPISLRNGSAIRALYQRFVANPFSDAGSMPVPLYTRSGRIGFGPPLTLFPYVTAEVAVGGAVVATLQLGSAVRHTPTLFLCAVAFSSWFGGLRPGIFAGLLSAILLDYYFIAPIYALGIRLEEAPDMIVFVASAVFVSWLNTERERSESMPASFQ